MDIFKSADIIGGGPVIVPVQRARHPVKISECRIEGKPGIDAGRTCCQMKIGGRGIDELWIDIDITSSRRYSAIVDWIGNAIIEQSKGRSVGTLRNAAVVEGNNMIGQDSRAVCNRLCDQASIEKPRAGVPHNCII